MQSTDPLPTSSNESSEQSNVELETQPVEQATSPTPITTEFLEAPVWQLLDMEFGNFTLEQAEALLASLRPVVQKPGELTKRLKEESDEIRTGIKKPRQSSEAKKKAIISSVL